ncbi:cation:proton antiporter regulatory subunit [Archaeoglobus veneficus]|uniref:TrkA-C domain protein n=1 Tax=Archaeoglobus veneficus (strain DSM 11195 / SNP6) TaxID=693661 RepID=F2KR77_ARCVS|nr:TrkA C-terminal domain-containing protein [Archaeoglobus veneficus]AEA46714.1 TrkA-C domain protein [Archaeoglobus veneficus SNP6]
MVRSIDLSGVGSKYELETEKGDRIAIVYLLSGETQLYLLEKGCDKPCVVELTPYEARRLGSILTGAIFETEKESVEIEFSGGLSDLKITVHTYVVGKNLAGKSIKDLAIRTKTGVTIIAISRKGKNIINPPPTMKLEEGDVIVVIGEHDQIKTFEREILGV